jgi:uncharacterized protein YndB with AHSA1/START domain
LEVEAYRRHGVIDAPLEDVWSLVSDPRSHPEWWPDVVEIRADGVLTEGDEYVRVSRRTALPGDVDAVWVVERLDHLNEAHFRCTASGSYARFALTPAQGQTFLEIETGMLPTTLRWRVASKLSRGYFVRWLRDVFDALPQRVRAKRSSSLQ